MTESNNSGLTSEEQDSQDAASARYWFRDIRIILCITFICVTIRVLDVVKGLLGIEFTDGTTDPPTFLVDEWIVLGYYIAIPFAGYGLYKAFIRGIMETGINRISRKEIFRRGVLYNEEYADKELASKQYGRVIESISLHRAKIYNLIVKLATYISIAFIGYVAWGISLVACELTIALSDGKYFDHYLLTREHLEVEVPYLFQFVAVGIGFVLAGWLFDRINDHLAIGVGKVIREDLDETEYTSIFKLVPSILRNDTK